MGSLRFRLNLFKKDTNNDKLNCLEGMYCAEPGKPYLLKTVHEAEGRVHAKKLSKGYQWPHGSEEFKALSAKLVFGKNSPVITEGRIITMQTLSGTGALSLGANFLYKFAQGIEVYSSDPGWPNYNLVFPQAGIPKKTYRYFDVKTGGIDFNGMCEDISSCAHNPTGCDLSKDQWIKICAICKEKAHVPFFDLAYQGFASGSLEDDAFAPRLFVQNGMEFLVAQSYSKNFGIYGERVGALHMVLNDNQFMQNVFNQFMRLISAAYVSPPVHGSYLVREVLEDPDLCQNWIEELKQLVANLVQIRRELYNHLVQLMPEKDWSAIIDQKGMFTFLGITPQQDEYLMKEHHVYITQQGRLSIAGLLRNRIPYLAKALVDTFKNCDKIETP
eukprot:g6320.t1